MYKIQIKKIAESKLYQFITWYKKLFINLYSDTWLGNENEIIENYINTWNELNSLIYKRIKSIFQEDLILYKSLRNKKRYVIIDINRYRLFIYYRENKRLKERYIDDLEIYKK